MQIIPSPKSYKPLNGYCCLSAADICVSPEFDIRTVKGAHRLCSVINSYSPDSQKSYVKFANEGKITIIKDTEGEKYSLSVSGGNVVIKGGDKGAFYGIETLMQIIKLSDGVNIPCLEIKDCPDFEVRGFYHDVTRGRVPTLDTLKELVDTLAMYKVNQLQLYVEDSFAFHELEGVMSREEVLSPDEITALDDYCNERFIELVPSVASFGHLYNQLQAPEYRHCCEYENYKPRQHYWLEKMSHHTVDISSKPAFEMICSRISQFASLCRSDKFNICCDETYDLCRGKNQGKDTGEEYFKYVLLLIDYVKSIGKTPMMWGDIVLHYPEKLSLLPKDTIMLNWGYAKDPDENTVKTFAESGMPQYVCPSTNAWNRFVEETGISHSNETLMAYYGKKYDALGYLNTNWGDYGNICAPGAERYGLVLGCERAWNATKDDLTDSWKKSFTKLEFFPDKKLDECPDMTKIIFGASKCEEKVRWMEFVPWFSANYIEGRDIPFEFDISNCESNITKCEEILEKLKSFDGGNENYTDLMLAAEAVIMMNRIYLYFAGKEKNLADYKDWEDRYAKAWNSRCKSSQLYILQDFLALVFSSKPKING